LSSATDAGVGEAALLRFAELIEQRLGLQFASSALKELSVVLRQRMRMLRCSGSDTYLKRLESAASRSAELRELAARLTIGETYFFRSPEQISVLSEVVIPRLTRRLTAMILLEVGQLDRAAQLCASFLAVDDLNAAAHYVTALCHEQGRPAAAVEAYRIGVYLDREFAMPHLPLGLMFKRDGDLPSTRREFENASILLAREHASRILLFGGGFSRTTLINLCASELRPCEESN
jgi:hypothetical protein